jgi:hypothetical protein
MPEVERAMGIEPTAQAWEAWVLPLYDARSGADSMPAATGAATDAGAGGNQGLPQRHAMP